MTNTEEKSCETCHWFGPEEDPICNWFSCDGLECDECNYVPKERKKNERMEC